LYEAEAFGFPQEAAEAAGYKKELEMAEAGLREMHRRGVRILPGGDYGFAWTPHGTYARDLQHFVERLGFTPMEAILSATALGGEIMLRPDDLGKVQPGYLPLRTRRPRRPAPGPARTPVHQHRRRRPEAPLTEHQSGRG
jgi:hypothetical protein